MSSLTLRRPERDTEFCNVRRPGRQEQTERSVSFFPSPIWLLQFRGNLRDARVRAGLIFIAARSPTHTNSADDLGARP